MDVLLNRSVLFLSWMQQRQKQLPGHFHYAKTGMPIQDQSELAEFCKQHDVPNDAKPIFKTKNGELVLVDKAQPGKYGSGEGYLIKKDGSVSQVRRCLSSRDGCRYVGEANSNAEK